MNRREFLGYAAVAGAIGSAVNRSEAQLEEGRTKRVKWQIGCFNRPWGAWSYDEALDQLKAAGFQTTGILGEHKGESFLNPTSTPEYLDELKQRIASRGLKPILARLLMRHDAPMDEAISQAHRQIDNAHRIGLNYVMALGTSKPEEYDHFYRLMAETAAYSATKNVHLVFKPHGGCSAASDDILRCIEKVRHPNFRLWYDAGNIIHYTGKDPIKEAERVASYVTGFCAKDCAKQGGDVMMTFGEGKVDFLGVFRVLKDAGFKGPVMIECCGGKTLEEVTASAKANRLYLERLFATL